MKENKTVTKTIFVRTHQGPLSMACALMKGVDGDDDQGPVSKVIRYRCPYVLTWPLYDIFVS